MNTELETCLIKGIRAFNVRKMLTQLGVPEDAEVTLKMQLGDNTTSIANCPVPTTCKQDNIPCGTLSLMSFRQLVVDDFINPALNTLEMGKYLPDDGGKFAKGESKLKIGFRSNTDDFNMNITLAAGCCRPGCNICCRVC